MGELGILKIAAEHDLSMLQTWMTPTDVPCELLQGPGAAGHSFEPLGVVAIYGAWNAPLYTTLKPMINAITAGNCCLIKPSEMAAESSKVIKKFCDKYMDNDAIITIEGGIEVAVPVNKLPLDLICFTGSTTVGKIIAKTAAENLTPCLLELGGKCPVIVAEDAKIEFTATKIAQAKTLNSG